MTMSERGALAVSLAVLGGIAAVVFPTLNLAAWVGFITWACFFQAGGDGEALKKSIAGNILGAVCAWVAVLLLQAINLDASLWMVRAVLVVGGTLGAMVMASGIAVFSLVPAAVYGYAATFGYLFQTPDARSMDLMLHFGRSNGLVQVIASVILGGIFGLGCKKMIGALTKK
jgi:hypothetical protein